MGGATAVSAGVDISRVQKKYVVSIIIIIIIIIIGTQHSTLTTLGANRDTT